MQVKPSTSIVVINHNYATYLEQSIESALSQGSAVDRVIIVDDGSTDGSHKIMEKYADRAIIVAKQQGGHVSAANAGFEKVTGDICIFLDADDYLYPHCINEVAKAWRPSASKVQFRLDTVDEHGVDQAMPFPHFLKSLTPDAVRRQSFRTGVYPWTVSSGSAFSHSYLERIMPIDASRIYRSPDGFLSKLAPLYGEVYSLPKILGAYRVHGTNAWAQSGGAFSADGVVRWLQFERVLETAFIEAAARQGVTIRKPLSSTFQQLEYRSLGVRFAPGRSPFRNDTRLRLILASVPMTLFAQNVWLVERIARLLWLWTINAAPAKFVETIVNQARGQSRRSPLAKRLLSLARGKNA